MREPKNNNKNPRLYAAFFQNVCLLFPKQLFHTHTDLYTYMHVHIVRNLPWIKAEIPHRVKAKECHIPGDMKEKQGRKTGICSDMERGEGNILVE